MFERKMIQTGGVQMGLTTRYPSDTGTVPIAFGIGAGLGELARQAMQDPKFWIDPMAGNLKLSLVIVGCCRHTVNV